MTVMIPFKARKRTGSGKVVGNLPHRGVAGDMEMMLVDLEGIEPTTYCVQGNRSPN